MRGLKKQRRIQVVAILTVALIGATALIGYAMRDGINFFRSPSEVTEAVWLKRAHWCAGRAKRLRSP